MTVAADVTTERRRSGVTEAHPGSIDPQGLAGSMLWYRLGGVILLAATAWFSWSLPAVPSRRTRPSTALVDQVGPWNWLLDRGWHPIEPGSVAISLIAVTACFFVAWSVVVARCWLNPGRSSVRIVLLLVAVCIAISVLALPNKTRDIYDYATFGRVVSVHQGEAYVDVPAQYPDDPILPYASRAYTGRPDNKLPAWTATAIVATSIAGDRPLTNLMVFRLLLGGATMASTVLIAWILGRIRPHAAAAGAALFGLNPVTVVFGPEKTDALMVACMLGAVALVVLGRRYLATAVMTVSVLVKMLTAPALLLLVAMPLGQAGEGGSSRRRRSRVGAARSIGGRVLVAAGTTTLVYGPFRDPIALARHQLSGGGQTSLGPALRPIAPIVAVLVITVVVGWAWARDSGESHERATMLVNRIGLLMVASSILLVRPGLPWYLMTALAAAAIAASVELFAIVGVLSAVSFLAGWWEALDSPVHPLPTIGPGRPVIYLMVAIALVAAAGGAAIWRTRRAA